LFRRIAAPEVLGEALLAEVVSAFQDTVVHEDTVVSRLRDQAHHGVLVADPRRFVDARLIAPQGIVGFGFPGRKGTSVALHPLFGRSHGFWTDAEARVIVPVVIEGPEALPGFVIAAKDWGVDIADHPIHSGLMDGVDECLEFPPSFQDDLGGDELEIESAVVAGGAEDTIERDSVPDVEQVRGSLSQRFENAGIVRDSFPISHDVRQRHRGHSGARFIGGTRNLEQEETKEPGGLGSGRHRTFHPA
jgi:hypothetical protein